MSVWSLCHKWRPNRDLKETNRDKKNRKWDSLTEQGQKKKKGINRDRLTEQGQTKNSVWEGPAGICRTHRQELQELEGQPEPPGWAALSACLSQGWGYKVCERQN